MNTIITLRKSRNMTQAQLAKLLNISQSAVAKWEAGECNPETKKIIALAKIFNCSTDELLGISK